MSSEREAAGMRVALMSYDERELRVRKFYLEEQSPTISCTCFQSGEPVLEALRKAWCFDVLVLSGQLEDMDSLTFIERLNQLPNRPALLVQGDGWYDDHTTSCLKRSRKMFCIEHNHLQDLLRGLLGVPGRNATRIEHFCIQLYEQWGIPQPNINCEYLTLALQVACSADGKLALRKEILRGVADEYRGRCGQRLAAHDRRARNTGPLRLGALQGRKQPHRDEDHHGKIDLLAAADRAAAGHRETGVSVRRSALWSGRGREKRNFRKNSWKRHFCTRCA